MTAPQTPLYQIESTTRATPGLYPVVGPRQFTLPQARLHCRRMNRQWPTILHKPVLYVAPAHTIYDEADYLAEVHARVEKEALAAGKRGRP